MSKWRTIDTAPEHIEILVRGGMLRGEIGIDKEYTVCVAEYYPQQCEESDSYYQWPLVHGRGYSEWVVYPTHWMPIPTAPKQEVTPCP
jgi:hypothetical protein